MHGDPAVDIVILSFNKAAYTRLCLNGVLHTAHRPLRVILVDNGSTDGTPALIEAFRDRAAAIGIGVTLIMNRENRGAIEGRNQALDLRQGGVLVFMDNDVAPAGTDWVGGLVRFLAATPDAGAVSPRLVYPVPPFLIQCAGCDVAPTGRVDFRGRGLPRTDPAHARTTPVQALISACMAVPRAMVDRVGGFDPQFAPVQFEDIDYSYRIKACGGRLYYLPGVELYHFENVTTSRSATLNPVYNTVKNGLKFKRKWQAVFAREGGPPESGMVWRDIPTVDMDAVAPALFPWGGGPL
ncbi:MAG: glycosyltransferase [Planctomycetota bacterium]